MTQLFRRAWSITVDDVLVSDQETGLACDFTVKKTLKPEPNTCDLKIYNLAPATREKLTNPKKSMVRIEAGYQDRVSMIYLGEVRALSPGEKQNADIITTLSSGDGEKEIQRSHLSVPIGGKTSNAEALTAIAKALKVGIGNVPKIAATLGSKGTAVFPRSTVVVGNVSRLLTDFCRSAGLEWSVQDGALQVLDLGAALETHPYILSADSGLYGSPSQGSDGKVSAQTAMLPELRVGSRVIFDSFAVKGLYRVTEAEYSGQTHSQEWGIKLVCEAPKKVA